MRWTLRNEVRAPGGLEVDAGSSAELIARPVNGTQRPNPEDARRLPGRSEGKLFERRNELIFLRAFPHARLRRRLCPGRLYGRWLDRAPVIGTGLERP